MRLALLLGLTLPLLSACATYQDDLSRAQTAFENNEHERALAILRGLELDTGHLSTAERAKYAYIRGMTDFRIGYRLEARHWLAVAVSIEAKTPQSIQADWLARANDALKDMNDSVFATGMSALANRMGDGADAKHEPKKVERKAAPLEEGAGAACKTDRDCSGDDVCRAGHCGPQK